MRKYRDKSPEEVMRLVTLEMIDRAIRFSRRRKRPIYISKTSGGRGVDVRSLDPRTPEGTEQLEKFLKPIKRHYTFSGLGAPEDPDAINWRALANPLPRRMLLQLQVGLSFLLKGNPFKNRFYRWMGVHVGRNTEIMQGVWLDHFRPELIFIGDHTLMGAFSRVTVHAYEGCGKFRYGLVTIGSNCVIGAGTGIGTIQVEDNVRTLPGTTISPYFVRIRRGSTVGWNPPPVQPPKDEAAPAE